MKNIFKSKRNILIMMFALVILMGIGFAAYSQQLQINDTSSIDSNWSVYIKNVSIKSKSDSATGNWAIDETTKLKVDLTTDLKYPGDNIIYNITVANDGTIDALLEKINFGMEKENTVIKYYYSVDDETTWNEVTKSGENPYNVDLLINTTDEFQVKVEYDPTQTGTATENQKSNKLTLDLHYVQKTGGGAVVPSGSLAAEQLKEKVTTSGDGLYEDTTESGRYIYKGANPNNYITFNGELWRIMSVDKDKTSSEDKWNLKIIRNESIGNKKFDSKGLRDSTSDGAGGTYCAQESYGCNAWTVSDNFVNGSKSGTVLKDAELNTYLNGAYLGTINEDSKYITNHDFNIGTPGNTSDPEDIATDIGQESLYKWNGKIGLMTITETLRTTTNTTCTSLRAAYNSDSTGYCNTNNWLWPKSGNIWTISPSSNYSDGVWRADSRGFATSTGASYADYGVLPAVYLTSDIGLDGEGTSSNPYTIISK